MLRGRVVRSEEHTSELQSLTNLVCRLLLEKKNHTATSVQMQTVHVLKDITDRRDAEQRYHELSDNIQEGIFFSTPQGRFIEVNDALVRILGYASRDELLQVDIPSTIYFNPERRQALASVIE